MISVFETQNPSNDEIAAVLPFYLTKTLSPADIAIIEKALESSPELQAELHQNQQVFDFAQKHKATLTAPQTHNSSRLENLLDRIDKFEAKPIVAKRTFWAKESFVIICKQLVKWITQPVPAISLAALALAQFSVIIWLWVEGSQYATINNKIAKANYEIAISSETPWRIVTQIAQNNDFVIGQTSRSGQIILASKSPISQADIELQIQNLQSNGQVRNVQNGISNEVISKSGSSPIAQGTICQNIKSDSLFWGYHAKAQINLSEAFSKIDTIDGEIRGLREGRRDKIILEKRKDPLVWQSGGYGNWGPTGGWQSIITWRDKSDLNKMALGTHEGNVQSMPNIIDQIDIRFGVNDGLSPGKAIVPQGVDSLYVVQRNIDYRKDGKLIDKPNSEMSLQIESFDINICGQQKL